MAGVTKFAFLLEFAHRLTNLEKIVYNLKNTFDLLKGSSNTTTASTLLNQITALNSTIETLKTRVQALEAKHTTSSN